MIVIDGRWESSSHLLKSFLLNLVQTEMGWYFPD